MASAPILDSNGNQVAGANVPALGPAAFNPAATSAAHEAMRERLWQLDTTYGGTESLRAAGERKLPRFERESLLDYTARLAGARLLRNMYRQAVDRTVGKLFEVPVKLDPAEEGSPAWAIWDDANLRGDSFDRVARDYARDALRRGLSHLLVDYPIGNYRNLAEERLANPRPYLIALAPQQVLESYEDDGGNCTYLRFYTRTLKWDPAARVVVMTEQVQERTPGAYTVWEQVTEAVRTGATYMPGKPRMSWVEVASGTVSQQRIMFHTLYAEREDHLIARTPLTEVMDLTDEVWELGSDLKNCLQRVLFPLLTVVGIDQKEVGTIELGPKSILGSSNKDAKFSYTEHTGKAIEAGQSHIDKLEQRAEVYAGQLTRPSGDVKATQAALSSAESSSWAKDFGLSLQDKLQGIIDDMALWQPAIGTPRVTVNLDFAVDMPEGDLTELGAARRAGDLSRPSYVKELMRRNILRADFSEDENESELEDEQAEGMEREEQMMRTAATIAAPREPAANTTEE